MFRRPLLRAFALLALASICPPTRADDDPKADGAERVGFLKDVAPILVQNCIACHNPKKAESKYDMTSFERLAKGGQQGEGITLEPGDPDASFLVELIRPDGVPRMPYKLDPLAPEQIATIERWVTQGAEYDGASPSEDWTAALHKTQSVEVPETYPVAVPITALAFSPDGRRVATSGFHEINLWNSADGSLVGRLRPLSERIYDLAYSPDGHWLATAAGDPGQYGAVKLWKAEADGSATPARDLAEESDCFFAVAFSPDGKRLAAAGSDRTIRIWESETGAEVARIEDHADWIFDLAFSADGKRLASASRDKTSKVFDVEKGESLATFPRHAEAVYGVAFGPEDKVVASGGGDNEVRTWTPDEDAKQAKSVTGFGGPVFKLLAQADGKRLFAAGADRTIRVVALPDGKVLQTLSGHDDWIYTLALSPDGKTLASGSWDGQVRLWEAEKGTPLRTFLAAPGMTSPALVEGPADARP